MPGYVVTVRRFGSDRGEVHRVASVDAARQVCRDEIAALDLDSAADARALARIERKIGADGGRFTSTGALDVSVERVEDDGEGR